MTLLTEKVLAKIHFLLKYFLLNFFFKSLKSLFKFNKKNIIENKVGIKGLNIK